MAMVHRREAARRDLVEHFVFLAESAGLDLADRFLKSAEVSFNDLADQPMMGSPLTLRHHSLAGMRNWRVAGFDNHLIFYLPRTGGVSIIRVLHSAQDWWKLLGIDS